MPNAPFTGPLAGLQQSWKPRGMAEDDPLGVALQGRAREQRLTERMQGPGTMGPLTNPAWDGWFQAMQERGVTQDPTTKQAFPLRGEENPSPYSNQLTGYSSQPTYFTPPTPTATQALAGVRRKMSNAFPDHKSPV